MSFRKFAKDLHVYIKMYCFVNKQEHATNVLTTPCFDPSRVLESWAISQFAAAATLTAYTMLVTKSVLKLIFVLSNYQTCTFPLSKFILFQSNFGIIPQVVRMLVSGLGRDFILHAEYYAILTRCVLLF